MTKEGTPYHLQSSTGVVRSISQCLKIHLHSRRSNITYHCNCHVWYTQRQVMSLLSQYAVESLTSLSPWLLKRGEYTWWVVSVSRARVRDSRDSVMLFLCRCEFIYLQHSLDLKFA